MHGLTKRANYVPGFPDQAKADLKAASEPGPKPYAIVIPIRKSADWWGLDQDKRAAMMLEHTDATVPYIKTVNGSSIIPADSMTWISSPILKHPS